jgi:Fic family protein
MSRLTDDLLMRYPHIRFSQRWTVTPNLGYLLGKAEAIVEAISGLPILPAFRRDLQLLSLAKGAQATAAIEGNTLSEDEVRRIEAGEELPPSKEYEQREVQNILQAFNTLLSEMLGTEHPELISPDLLKRFHEMIGRDLGERFAAIPGQFAKSQRVVGPYRAPAPDDIEPLVSGLCEWLPREFHFPTQRFTDAVIQSIVTHVYIEWIHPFDDGNGRTGRLVEFYILLRAGLPSIASHLLANHYNLTRADYYRNIQIAKQTNDLTAFLEYAVGGLVDGLLKTLQSIHKNAMEQMWRVLVYDKFGARKAERRDAFRRRRSLALALPLDRPIAFDDAPRLSDELRAAYQGLSSRTILRDIGELLKLELVVREPGLIRANRSLLDNTLAQRRRAEKHR